MTLKHRGSGGGAGSARASAPSCTGKVTSAKMEKTIVVEVQRLVQHPNIAALVAFQRSFMPMTKRARPRTGDTVPHFVAFASVVRKLKRWRSKKY